MCNWRTHRTHNLCAEAGFTLVEALVSTAIVVSVATVVTSLLFTLLRSHQWFLQRTDQYESLRIAAAHIRQDARFATLCTFGLDHVKLYLTPPSDYIMYQIMPDAAGKYDLHRVHYQGGNPQNDEIVGWDVLPAVSSGPIKTFTCVGSSGQSARVRLQSRALPGEKAAPKLDVFSFQRGG